MAESQGNGGGDLMARWERYFRMPDQFGDDEGRVQVAASAAVRAARRGATSEVAAEVGRTEAKRPISQPTRAAEQSASPEPSRGGRRAGAPPGSRSALIGEAIDVQQRQQLDGGTTLLSIEFLLRNRQGKLAPVVLRGTTVTGRIAEGDEVEVKAAQRSRSGQLFASRVYNHTQQHEVQAGVGPTGSWNWWRMAKMRKTATVFGPILLLLLFLTWIAVIAVVANGWVPDFLTGSEQTVTVPDVTGLGSAEASDRLLNAGLRPVMDFEKSGEVEWGEIIRQTPEAGQKIQEGSSVYIFQAT